MQSDYDHIRREHQLDYGRKLKVWAQDHLANRYSDRTHFIFELLQNAEDALRERAESSLPTSVSFNLKPDGLEVRHFGKLFEPDNVKSICAINESTKKEELTEIGRFGIGFKSVYAFSRRPEVHSGCEHFAIEDFVLPVATKPRQTDPEETVFWLPFSKEDLSAADEIANALRSLGSRRLLFLKFVTEITWSLPDGTVGIFLKNPPDSNQEGQQITLLSEVKGQTNVEENWLLFSRPVATPDRKPAGSVEIAFLLGNNEKGEPCVREVSDLKLVVFFPTELATGLGFLVQGPYRTTPSRDVVPPNDAWNLHLVEETAELLVHSLRALKNSGRLGVEALRTLPLDPRLYPMGSMLRRLFERVRDALRTEALLPTTGGGHAAGSNARLARGEGLRELFTPKQLAMLLGSAEAVYWLSEEITKDRAATLREFLMQQVGVVELSPDSIVPRLTEGFIRQQPDTWIGQFYDFFSSQKAMLRELIERGTPFVRCEDDSHVPPKRGQFPQAFLPSEGVTGFRTVKRAVCSSPTILDFLRSVGLSEPDPVDDVVQNVLCNYANASVQRSDDEYESDLRRMFRAFATDSDQQRRKLIEGLRNSHFVRARNASTGDVRFLKPEYTYRATQRMKAVFADVKDVWLIDDQIGLFKGEAARDLLQACGVLDVLRTTPCEPTLTWQEKEALRVKQGNNACSWESIEEEADCASVSALLTLLPTLSTGAALQRAVEFWQLLRDTLHDRRESYFRARYRWSYSHRSWACIFPASWVRSLHAANWVPDSTGVLRKPSELCVSDAHPRILELAHPMLTELLGFRPEAIKELAEKEGIDLEALNLLKQHNLTAEQLRALLGVTDNHDGTGSSENEEESGGTPDSEGTGDDDNADNEEEEYDGDNDEGDSGENGSGGGRGGGSGSGAGGGGAGRKSKGGPSKTFYTYVGVDDGTDPKDDENLSADERREIEEAAISYILQLEPTLERTPTNNPGFDLFEGESLEFIARVVEVKSKKGEWNGAVALSEEQFRLAASEGERFWLYVVEFAQDEGRRRLHRIQDPAGKTRYFTFDPGWKAVATKQNSEEKTS